MSPNSMSPSLYDSISQCLHVSISPSLCLHVSMSSSPCLCRHVSWILQTENKTNRKRQLPFVFCKRKTEMAKLPFVCCKWKRKTDVYFPWSAIGKWQTVTDDCCFSKRAHLGKYRWSAGGGQELTRTAPPPADLYGFDSRGLGGVGL